MHCTVRYKCQMHKRQSGMQMKRALREINKKNKNKQTKPVHARVLLYFQDNNKMTIFLHHSIILIETSSGYVKFCLF